MKHAGSCHCGRIAFELEADIKEVADCNCSLCRRRGGLLWFGPRAALALKTPESDLSTEAIATGKRRRGRVGMEKISWSTTIILMLCAVTVLLPLRSASA